eukprot:1158649-Pelagomonas_calceolata.AAC.3
MHEPTVIHTHTPVGVRFCGQMGTPPVVGTHGTSHHPHQLSHTHPAGNLHRGGIAPVLLTRHFRAGVSPLQIAGVVGVGVMDWAISVWGLGKLQGPQKNLLDLLGKMVQLQGGCQMPIFASPFGGLTHC